jgi:hypothetical protein
VAAPPGEISIAAGSDGTIAISFTGTPGASYNLEANDSLDASGWKILGSAAAQSDGTWQMTDTISGALRFYRVSAGQGN